MEKILSQDEILRVKSSLVSKSSISSLVSFSDNDLDNAGIICNDIYTIGDSFITNTPSISIFTLIDSTIFNMGLFDTKEYKTSRYVSRMLENIRLNTSNKSDYMSTQFTAINSELGWIRIPDGINIPSNIKTESIAHLSHELTHIMKEFNPKEFLYINTLQDMLPLLVELIIALENDDLKTKLNIINRMQQDFYATVLRSKEILNKIVNVKDELYRMYMKEALLINYQYYNSLYYALAVLDIYINDPFMVINEINKVLQGKATTIELIDNLFENEHDKEKHYINGITEYNSYILKG